MYIEEHRIDGVVLVKPSGRLWSEADGEALNAVFTRLLDEGCSRVVLDLAHVPLMNSSGLGTVIAGLKAFRNHGGDLKLANAGDRIHHLLRITKLNQVVETYPSPQDAVNSFKI